MRALPVAVLVVSLAAFCAADQVYHHWTVLGDNARVTASTMVPGTNRIVVGWVDDVAESVSLSLMDGGDPLWTIKLQADSAQLFDVRYDEGRSLLWLVGATKGSVLTIRDTTGKSTTHLFDAITETSESVQYYAAALSTDGVVETITGVTAGWDSKNAPLASVVSAEITKDKTVVLVAPFYDSAVSGSSSIDHHGLNVVVGVIPPDSNTMKLYLLAFDTAAGVTDAFVTAVEPSNRPDAFFATGFVTVGGKRHGVVMRVALKPSVGALVEWFRALDVQPASQSFELSSLQSSADPASANEVAVAVGSFTGDATTDVGKVTCAADRCVLVVAFGDSGAPKYQTVISAVGKVDDANPLFIASNGTNVVITGPCTAATHIGDVSLFEPLAPVVFLAAFGSNGVPLYLNALFDGAKSASVYTMSTSAEFVYLGGTIEATNLEFSGIPVSTSGVSGYLAVVSPFIYGQDDTLPPPEELGYEWASVTTVVVLFLFGALGLALIGFLWYRSRRAGRRTRTTGRNNRYTTLQIHDDDLNDITVFGIDDDSL